VIVGEWIRKAPPSPTGEFGYVVSTNSCEAVITGGTLPDGVTGFLICPGIERSFWRRLFCSHTKSDRLIEMVHEILTKHGARSWDTYESDMTRIYGNIGEGVAGVPPKL
jgi:hypothetical protein